MYLHATKKPALHLEENGFTPQAAAEYNRSHSTAFFSTWLSICAIIL